MTTLVLTRDERIHLAGILSHFVKWDPQAIIRILTKERTLGILADAPMGVLVFVALPLAEKPTETIDRGVSAHRLRDAIGDPSGPSARIGAASLKLPDERGLLPSLAAMPSRDGWIPAEKATAGEVKAALDTALAEFQRRVEAVEDATDERKQQLAREWWAEPSWGGLPLKALHAAGLLGMLAFSGARIESATRAGWKRLVSPAGQVFVAPPTSYSGIALSVVK